MAEVVMRTDIEILELPSRLPEAIALAQAGDEVVLTNEGVALVKLVAVQPAGEPQKVPILGLRPGAITLAPDFNDPLPDEFWMGEE